MIKHAITIIILVLLVWRIASSVSASSKTEFPHKPIQIVVPYLAGGGTDTFTRIIQKSLIERDALGVPVVIINQDGGSATIGSRFVKNSKPDGHRILCHHEGIIATKLAGVVPYGPEAFRPIAQTGAIVLLMVVRADSEFNDLNDLLAAAQKNPNKIRIGANQGSPAYFICKQLLSEYPGAEFNFIAASGSKRHLYLLGDKLEAGIFSLAEYTAFRDSEDKPPSENIRAIANFGKQRHTAIPDVATSLDQNLKTQADNAYYFWAPKDTPDKVVNKLAVALKGSLEDPKVIEQMNNLSLDLTFRSGDELTDHLAGRVEAFEKLAVKADAKLPDFPLWTIGIVLALLAVVAVQSFKGQSEPAVDPMFGEKLAVNSTGFICLMILVSYIAALQFEIPFVVGTAIAIFLMGATIAQWNRQKLFSLLQLALLFSLSIEVIFTQLFTVALP